MQVFLKIRFKQISRVLQGLGMLRFIFLVAVVVFIAFIFFMQTTDTPNSYYMTAAYLAIIAVIHIKRPDKRFLKIHFEDSRQMILMEYLLLLIPLLFCLIYHQQWSAVIAVPVLTLLLVNIDFRPRQKSLNTALQRLIPSDCFEWKGGVRQSIFVIVALWIIALATSFFFGSVPVALFLLGILPWGFYEKCEPVQMLLAYEKGTTDFLLLKIKRQSTLFTILAVPLIVAFLFFHLDRWYIPVAEYIIILTTYVYIILTKYAFYQPNNKSNGAQVFELIGAIGLILPFFIPVVWLLSIRFYFKSRKNLNFYLNDFN